MTGNLSEPDLSPWIEKYTHWRLFEAAYLLAGQRPDVGDPTSILLDRGEVGDFYRMLKDAAFVSKDLPFGHSLVSTDTWVGFKILLPVDVVSWAYSRGLKIPPALRSLSTRQTALLAPSQFKSMAGLTWNEVSMKLMSREAVRIQARDCQEAVTYEQLGFKNKKSRTAEPTFPWELFRILALADGELTWRQIGQLVQDGELKHPKQHFVQIRKLLKAYFGIDENPIVGTRERYKTEFNLLATDEVRRHFAARLSRGDERAGDKWIDDADTDSYEDDQDSDD